VTITSKDTIIPTAQVRILGNHREGSSTTSLTAVALLLDMDGTLVDSTAAVERQWRTFLGWYDLPSHRLPTQLHGKRAVDHVASLLPAEQVGAALLRFAELEQRDLAGITPVPGALELLTALEAALLPWAVVTSGTRPVVAARLKAAGLPSPPVLVSAEDVTAGKPDPEPYQCAVTQLGLTHLSDPSLILAIEDAPAGIISAHRAGCTVIALSTTHHPSDLHKARVITPDLRSLTLLTTKGPGNTPSNVLAPGS